MKMRVSPFVLLCIMGGLAIFSSTMAKNPVLPLFIRALEVPIVIIPHLEWSEPVLLWQAWFLGSPCAGSNQRIAGTAESRIIRVIGELPANSGLILITKGVE